MLDHRKSPALRGFVAGRRSLATTSLYLAQNRTGRKPLDHPGEDRAQTCTSGSKRRGYHPPRLLFQKRTQRPTRANRGVPAIAGAETKSGGCTVCSLRRGLRCAASAARTGWSGRQHFYGEGEKSAIMVADHDAECVRTILSEMGELCPPNPKPNPMYRTKTFMELLIDSVDVDVMAGFAIVKDGKVYDCALHKEQIVEKMPWKPRIRTNWRFRSARK